MNAPSRKPIALTLALLLVMASAAAAPQGKSQKKDQKKDQPAEQQPAQQQPPPAQPQPAAQPQQPAPLLGGGSKITLKSSRQSRDAASAGFNGVGPDGHVDKSRLSSAPTSVDQMKAAQLAAFRVDANEVDAFIQEGKLNPAATKPATK